MIASAAGVAEGTLFRAFPDKEALISAAVDAALDARDTQRALAAVDPGLPLPQLLLEVVTILQRDYVDTWRILRHLPPSQEWAAAQEVPELVELLSGHRKALRVPPRRAAAQTAAVTLALSHPSIYPGGPAPADQIVTLLLEGVSR